MMIFPASHQCQEQEAGFLLNAPANFEMKRPPSVFQECPFPALICDLPILKTDSLERKILCFQQFDKIPVKIKEADAVIKVVDCSFTDGFLAAAAILTYEYSS
jgi:hypothetical protein